MKVHFTSFLCAFVLLTGAARGQETVDEQQVTHQHLEKLDEFRAKLEDTLDNEYIYQQQRAEYLEAMSRLPGMKLEWPAMVQSVRQGVVHLRPAQWGRTRIVLTHFTERGAKSYGHLNFTPPRCVPPAAHRYARHAARTDLEIGLEMPLELAQTLRVGDLVQMSGHIDHVDTRLFRGNGPDTLVYVANMEARKYMTPEEIDALDDAAYAKTTAAAANAPTVPGTVVETP